jgi:hypothetical protein
MSSTYTTSLTLTQIGNGEQSGTWGTTTNTNWQLIEDSVAGVAQVTVSGSTGATLSVANGTTDQSRNAVIVVTGSISTSVAIVAPLVKKVYIISNQTSGGFAITVGATTGSTVTIPSNTTTLVYCDGTNFFSGITGFSGNLSITGTINATGTITAPIFSGNLGGGATNKIPVQTSSSTTSFIDPPPSSGSATILTFTPGSGFSWSTGTVSALAGGTTNSLVYQSSPGVTQFFAKPGTSDVYYLTYNGGSNSFVWSLGGSVASVTASAPLGITGTATNPNVSLTGLVPIASGGTAASTAAQARINLNVPGLGDGNNFTGANTYSTTGSIQFTGSNSGDQRLGVTYSTYSSGLSATSLQLGANGNGIVYDPPGSVFDGGSGIGLISGSGGANFQISSTGNIYTSAPHAYKTGSTTAWEIYSDARIKRNVTPYTKGLAELNQIQIKNFEFNGLAHSKEGEKGLGVIADEIKQILPDCVHTIPTLLNPTDTEKVDLNTFDATELLYLLVNSVKELSAEVTALKAKVGA